MKAGPLAETLGKFTKNPERIIAKDASKTIVLKDDLKNLLPFLIFNLQTTLEKNERENWASQVKSGF